MQSHYFPRDRASTETLSLALGWFSIALGAAELMAPRRVARLIGVPADDRTLNVLRAYGARKLASGIAHTRRSPRSQVALVAGGWRRGRPGIARCRGVRRGHRARARIAWQRWQCSASPHWTCSLQAWLGNASESCGQVCVNEQAMTIKATIEAVGSRVDRVVRVGTIAKLEERLRGPLRARAGRARHRSASRRDAAARARFVKSCGGSSRWSRLAKSPYPTARVLGNHSRAAKRARPRIVTEVRR